MKNKKTLYFLAPAVLLVWSLIVYQLSEGLSGGNPYYSEAGRTNAEIAPVASDSFQYSLLLNYPDPFLGRTSAPARSTSAVVRSEPKAPVQPAPTVPVQEVVHNPTRYQYLGLIEHKGKKDKLALLMVDGKSLMLREGEAAESLQLVKIGQDSVQLKSGKLLFYVKR